MTGKAAMKLKETYPLYLNNKPEQPNADLEVTDKYTGEVAFRTAMATPEIIDRASTLVLNFFMPVAERLFSRAAVVRETEAESLFNYLRRLGKSRINVRNDIQRGHGSPFRDKATIDTIMEELRLRGVTRQPVYSHDRPGRLPGDWEINPAIVTRRND